MKKRLLQILWTCGLISVFMISASAETMPSKSGWWVKFTQGEVMESNFKTADYNDPVYGLQPGDDVNFSVELTNEHSATTDWYMTNEVLHSLEDRSNNDQTAGGAYSYVLTYTGPDGTQRELYNSDTVGGEDISDAGEGLHEATTALADYFYLDTLTSGQKGTVNLNVALDGETQGNDYQDTLADLQMNFAVELNATTPTSPSPSPNKTTTTTTTTTTRIVKTGDETNLLPYYIAMGISGLLLLVLAIYGVMKRRSSRKGDASL